MGDLIYRDAIHAYIKHLFESIDGNAFLPVQTISAVILSAINCEDTVDAAPVVHGRLLRTDAYPHRLYCSNCYHTIVPNEEMVPLYNMTINYCLHCGAKFDGGEV